MARAANCLACDSISSRRRCEVSKVRLKRVCIASAVAMVSSTHSATAAQLRAAGGRGRFPARVGKEPVQGVGGLKGRGREGPLGRDSGCWRVPATSVRSASRLQALDSRGAREQPVVLSPLELQLPLHECITPKWGA